MKISIIAAMDRGRGIGMDGRLPWQLSADLQHFKRLTTGHSLIQGRVTWESIGRPLPGRRMVVVTGRGGYPVPEGVQVAGSLAEALALARAAGDSEAFIGGGAALYSQSLPIADRIYLTRVDALVAADVFFPEFDESGWRVQTLFEQAADEKNQFAFRIDLLERAGPPPELSFSDSLTFFHTRDLPSTARFYEDVLGLRLCVDQGGCRIYRTSPGGFIGFCERETATQQPGGVVLTFVTGQVDEWADRLRRLGVQIERGPVENKAFGIYHFFFRDPNGYLLEVQRFLDPDWRELQE